VNLSPGANIHFCLAAGSYAQQSVVPKNNDQFIGGYSAVLDGEKTTAHAFSGTASGVVIQNLKIINYNPSAVNLYASDSAVQGDYSYGWTVKKQ